MQWVEGGEHEKRTESHPHILQQRDEPYIKYIVYHVRQEKVSLVSN